MIWKNKGERWSRESSGYLHFVLVYGRYSESEIEQKVEQLREQLLASTESDNDQEM